MLSKSILFSLLICFTFYTSYSQKTNNTYPSTGTLKGIVVDSASKLYLSHVSVEVYISVQKNVIKNTITNDSGFFELTELPLIRCQIKLSHIGFKDTTIALHLLASNTFFDLGQIKLASIAKQLKEVQVATQKQVIEQDADKLTYNVDADPESKTATAFEILRKVPLLTLDADDNLQLNGNSNYKILINGKSSTLFSLNQSDVFKNMSASVIKTIEVITIPPSKYEASGTGGIINITTYKKNIGGYNGGINLKGSSPKGFSTNANATVKFGKFSISGNGGFTTNNNPVSTSSLIRLDKIRQNKLKQFGSSESNNRSNNAGAGITYEINSQNLVTASYSTTKSRSSNNFNQLAELFNSKDELKESYQRLNKSKNKNFNNNFAFEYQQTFKKNGEQQLSLSYVINKGTNKNNTDFILQPLINYKYRASTSNNEDATKEKTFQGDYVQPIKKHTLEMGLSSISRKNNSDYFYKNLDTSTGVFVLDTIQSNNFNYKEDILSAYASINLRTQKWSLKAGARIEKAKIDAHFLSSRTLAKNKYLNLVPNLTLSRQLKGISMIKLSYTQRIQRPDLYYLNPFIDITDPLNISYGNPNLKPALGHIFNFSYNTFIKKTSFNISIFHQFTCNAIQQFTILSSDTISRTSFGNIGKNKNTSFSISGNSTVSKKLSITLNSMINYLQYNSYIEGKPNTNNGLNYNVNGSFNLRFKNWHAGNSIGYSSPNILVQGKTAGYFSNSISANKYFFKDKKVNVGFSVNNPFNRRRQSSTELSDATFYQLRESLSVIRRFNLSLSYRFNKVNAGQ